MQILLIKPRKKLAVHACGSFRGPRYVIKFLADAVRENAIRVIPGMHATLRAPYTENTSRQWVSFRSQDSDTLSRSELIDPRAIPSAPRHEYT